MNKYQRFSWAFTSMFVFLIIIGCTNRIYELNKNNNPSNSQSLIVGKWELIDRGEYDSLGVNKVEQDFEPLLEFGSDNSKPNDKKTSSPQKSYLSFNSSGEAFSPSSSDYGFSYQLNDSILSFAQEYKVLTLNDSVLKIIELPELAPLFGGYEVQTFKRIDFVDQPSNRFIMKNLLLGKWNSDYLIPVKTHGIAHFEEKEVIIDTLNTQTPGELYLSFDETKFEMGNISSNTVGTFKYDVVDSMINVDRIHFFTILNISKDSLSLLGIHTPTNQKKMAIWKMYKVK